MIPTLVKELEVSTWSRRGVKSNLAQGMFALIKDNYELQPDWRSFQPGRGAWAPT